MRRLPRRHRHRPTRSTGSRLQPRVPRGMRRHLALQAPSLSPMQSQTRPHAFLFLRKSLLNSTQQPVLSQLSVSLNSFTNHCFCFLNWIQTLCLCTVSHFSRAPQNSLTLLDARTCVCSMKHRGGEPRYAFVPFFFFFFFFFFL